jgi:hypothetical protein
MVQIKVIKPNLQNRPIITIKNQTPVLEAVSINYDICLFIPGIVTVPNEVLTKITVARNVTFSNNYTGSVGSVGIPPADDYIITIGRD